MAIVKMGLRLLRCLDEILVRRTREASDILDARRQRNRARFDSHLMERRGRKTGRVFQVAPRDRLKPCHS